MKNIWQYLKQFQESQKEKMLKEQQMAEGNPDNNVPTNAANEKTFELEPKEKLIEALLPGLTHDKIIGMMNVRKGRVSAHELYW